MRTEPPERGEGCEPLIGWVRRAYPDGNVWVHLEDGGELLVGNAARIYPAPSGGDALLLFPDPEGGPPQLEDPRWWVVAEPGPVPAEGAPEDLEAWGRGGDLPIVWTAVCTPRLILRRFHRPHPALRGESGRRQILQDAFDGATVAMDQPLSPSRLRALLVHLERLGVERIPWRTPVGMLRDLFGVRRGVIRRLIELCVEPAVELDEGLMRRRDFLRLTAMLRRATGLGYRPGHSSTAALLAELQLPASWGPHALALLDEPRGLHDPLTAAQFSELVARMLAAVAGEPAGTVFGDEAAPPPRGRLRLNWPRVTHGGQVTFQVTGVRSSGATAALVGTCLGQPAVLPRRLLHWPRCLADVALDDLVGQQLEAFVIDPLARPVLIGQLPGRSSKLRGRELDPSVRGYRPLWRPGHFLLAMRELSQRLRSVRARVAQIDERVLVEYYGVRALLPRERLTWYADAERAPLPSVGDTVDLHFHVDLEEGAVQLSATSTADPEWGEICRRYPVGIRVQPEVVSRTRFGLRLLIRDDVHLVRGYVPAGEFTDGNDPDLCPPLPEGFAAEVIGHGTGELILSLARCRPSGWRDPRLVAGEWIPVRLLGDEQHTFAYWLPGYCVPVEVDRAQLVPALWMRVARHDPERRVLELCDPRAARPGHVLSVDGDMALVRFRDGLEARISGEGVAGLQVGGERVEVELTAMHWEPGGPRLEGRLADRERLEERAELEVGERIDVHVLEAVEGGLRARYHRVDVFLPTSQLIGRQLEHPQEMVGQTVGVEVIEARHLQERYVVSVRRAVERQRQERWVQRVAEIDAAGGIADGVVQVVFARGVIVDMGDVQGFLSVADMAHEPVRQASSMFRRGDRVRVKLLSADPLTRRIRVGRKQLLTDPWQDIARRFPPGSVVDGRVVHVAHSGATVEVADGVLGHVHKSEFVRRGPTDDPPPMLRKGETVRLKVLGIDRSRRLLALSRRAVMPNPYAAFAARHAEGSRLRGRVSRLLPAGAIVDLGGVEGLLHHRNAAGVDPATLRAGTEVDVLVLAVRPEERRISLAVDPQAAG